MGPTARTSKIRMPSVRDTLNPMGHAMRSQACLSGPEQCGSCLELNQSGQCGASADSSVTAGGYSQRRSASHPSDCSQCGLRPSASLMLLLQQQPPPQPPQPPQQQPPPQPQQSLHEPLEAQQQVQVLQQMSQPERLYGFDQLPDHLEGFPAALSEPPAVSRPPRACGGGGGGEAAGGPDGGGSGSGDPSVHTAFKVVDAAAAADAAAVTTSVRAASQADPSHHSGIGMDMGWLDAGSVWSSVQRRGEELQRRQRQAHPPQPPGRQRTWATSAADAAGAVAAGASAWRRGPWRRFVQRVRTSVIVTARVAAKDPCTIVIPLVLLLCMLALGLWGVFSVSSATAEGRRQAALNAATDFSNTLKSHIAATVAPASTVKTLIEIEPTWSIINQTFHTWAPSLVQKGLESDAILTIVLAPQGIVSAIVPTGLPAWSQVYGLDLLQNLSWRNDALKTVMMHDQGMVMTGPSKLRAGMMGIVCRYAVFITGAGPNETFGFNGSAYNCTPCYEPPPNATATSKRFWGFAQLNVDWEVLLHNITHMRDLCERDNLSYNMTYIDPVTFANRSIAACGTVGRDPVVVHIDTMANHWVLAVSDMRGWTPNWLPLVVVVVVVVSLWVAIAMAIILVNRREHMWLLQAMLPKKVIATLRRGEEYAEAFECVTVLFSDIVSYTTLAAEMEPIKVVRLLNEMYSEYDALVDQFECYKVETIGDAFMAVCGTQGEDAVAAAVKIAHLAQAMIERTRVLVSADGQKIQIRIGLHSGPVVGAVVGFKMPHFCLCGDTVNTASRMESNSRPMKIHISNSTAALLLASGGDFRLQRRGLIPVKGKGQMLTHWLLTPEEYDSDNDGGGAVRSSSGAGGTVGLLITGEAAAEEEAAVAGVVEAAGDRQSGHVRRAGTAEQELPSLASALLEEMPPASPLLPPGIMDAAAEAAAEAAAAATRASLAAPKSASALLSPTSTITEGVDDSGCGNPHRTAAASNARPSTSVSLMLGGGGNARRRFSEACAVRSGSAGSVRGGGGGGGHAAVVSPSQPGIGASTSSGVPGGSTSSGGGGSNRAGGSTAAPGGGGTTTVTMSCNFVPAAGKRSRNQVDLRLFQLGGRTPRQNK